MMFDACHHFAQVIFSGKVSCSHLSRCHTFCMNNYDIPILTVSSLNDIPISLERSQSSTFAIFYMGILRFWVVLSFAYSYLD